MKTSLKLALFLLIAGPASGRAQALSPGFELERTGRYADAATVYLTIVRADAITILPRPSASLNNVQQASSIRKLRRAIQQWPFQPPNCVPV